VTSSFVGCKLTAATLTEARSLRLSLQDTLLLYAKLSGLSFKGAQLEGVVFWQADLTG